MTGYLRIAAAGFFALLTVALVGLWVRSHYYHDQFLGFNRTHYLMLFSDWNVITCIVERRNSADAIPPWEVGATPIEFEKIHARWRRGILAGLGFKRESEPGRYVLAVPHWFLATSSLALTVVLIPKRTWQFTIRRLLIITTIVAIAVRFGVFMY